MPVTGTAPWHLSPWRRVASRIGTAAEGLSQQIAFAMKFCHTQQGNFKGIRLQTASIMDYKCLIQALADFIEIWREGHSDSMGFVSRRPAGWDRVTLGRVSINYHTYEAIW